MGIKSNIFCSRKNPQYSFIPFFQPSLDAGNSLKWILGIFQDGVSLVTHSQILSTFQHGSRVKFPTPGIVVNFKIPTHVRFTKSNSPSLPDPPPPPILGLTNDRCITRKTSFMVVFPWGLGWGWNFQKKDGFYLQKSTVGCSFIVGYWAEK